MNLVERGSQTANEGFSNEDEIVKKFNYDEEQYPWLKTEKEFILKSIEAKKTVIGICLGSQLIASVLWAKVYPNKKKKLVGFPCQKPMKEKRIPF